MADRLELRLEEILRPEVHRRLENPVPHGGDGQMTLAPFALVDGQAEKREGAVGAAMDAPLETVQLVLEIRGELEDGDAVDSPAPCPVAHPLERSIESVAGGDPVQHRRLLGEEDTESEEKGLEGPEFDRLAIRQISVLIRASRTELLCQGNRRAHRPHPVAIPPC
jgi:hypothetical protein